MRTAPLIQSYPQTRTIQFEIPAAPQPKLRPRFARRGSFVTTRTPEKTEQAECDVAFLAAQHAPEHPQEGGVMLDLLFVLPVPMSWSKKKQAAALAGHILPTGRPDLDNLEKLVADSLSRSGRWWRNDSQIVESHPRKVYGARPCSQIGVTFLNWRD